MIKTFFVAFFIFFVYSQIMAKTSSCKSLKWMWGFLFSMVLVLLTTNPVVEEGNVADCSCLKSKIVPL